MKNITRRTLLKSSAVGAVGIATSGAVNAMSSVNDSNKKVVIVGGGIGGATAAQYLRKA